MRKFKLFAIAIIFLVVGFTFGQTPTPTATPKAMPSPGPTPTATPTPKKRVSQPGDGTSKQFQELRMQQSLGPYVMQTSKEICWDPMDTENGKPVSFPNISCWERNPISKPTPSATPEQKSNIDDQCMKRVLLRGIWMYEADMVCIFELKRNPEVPIKQSNPSPRPNSILVTNEAQPYKHEPSEIELIDGPKPKIISIQDSGMDSEKKSSGLENPFSDPTADPKQTSKRCTIEVSTTTGVNSDYDGMDVGGRFYDGWVANNNLNIEACGNKSVTFGAYTWNQMPITNLKSSFAWENDIGGYINFKLPKGWGIGADVAIFNVKGGSIMDYSFSVSKEIPMEYGYKMEIINEASFYTVSKNLGLRGGFVNKTSYPISHEFFRGAFTAALIPAHSFDNNPFEDHAKLNARGFITGSLDFPIYNNWSLGIFGTTYFKLFGTTDRQNGSVWGFKFTYTKKFRE